MELLSENNLRLKVAIFIKKAQSQMFYKVLNKLLAQILVLLQSDSLLFFLMGKTEVIGVNNASVANTKNTNMEFTFEGK